MKEVFVSVLSIISQSSKVSDELYLNKILGGASGFLVNAYSNVYVSNEMVVNKVMEHSHYNEALFDEFHTLIKKGYVEFNQNSLEDINALHLRYKSNKFASYIRLKWGSDSSTVKLKKALAESDDQEENARLVFSHMKAKKTDYSIVLMDYFLTGKLFKPSKIFENLHEELVGKTHEDIPLDRFFIGVIHAVENLKGLLDKMEADRNDLDNKVMESYHQNDASQIEIEQQILKQTTDLKKEELRLEFEFQKKKLELEYQKKTEALQRELGFLPAANEKQAVNKGKSVGSKENSVKDTAAQSRSTLLSKSMNAVMLPQSQDESRSSSVITKGSCRANYPATFS